MSAVVAFAPTHEQQAIVAATRAQKRLQPNSTLETMSKLSDSLEKIRARAAANMPHVVEAAPMPLVNAELDRSRSQFLALPAVIRAAMKRAADAEVWTPETWRVEVALATEILDLDESASAADNLARLYENAAGGQETLL